MDCAITLAPTACTSSAVMLFEHSVHALDLTIALRECFNQTSQENTPACPIREVELDRTQVLG